MRLAVLIHASFHETPYAGEFHVTAGAFQPSEETSALARSGELVRIPGQNETRVARLAQACQIM